MALIPPASLNAAQALVATLCEAGIDVVTCVPGESYLAVLDALYDKRDEISLITCRQEGGAATMAEVHARLSGKPGICFVTRGPGATNAAIGVHNAKQNSTPMVLFIGQVPRAYLGREAFQEVDFKRMFAPLAKWAVEVLDSADMARVTAEALHMAQSGRPGPVVVSLPEDMLNLASPGVANIVANIEVRTAQKPNHEMMKQVKNILHEAERPMAIIGGSTWSAAAAKDFTQFCEAAHIPVACGFRRQALIDHRSPAYVGHLGLGPDIKLIDRVRAADVILALGTRLGDITSQGYQLFEGARPSQQLIHITPDQRDIGLVFKPRLGIVSRADDFVASLAEPPKPNRNGWMSEAREEYLAFTQSRPQGLSLNQAEIFKQLRSSLADDAILTNGAGNFSIWAHRYFPLHGYNTQLGPVSGAMGYALPAALAAKWRYPEREVIAVTGDGDFMMTVQELATARQYDLRVIVLLFNNAMLGTIRMHQERHYPDRVIGTDLHNPDFAALARAHGLAGFRVERTQDFAAAFAEARACKSAAVIELVCDPLQITPSIRLPEKNT